MNPNVPNVVVGCALLLMFVICGAMAAPEPNGGDSACIIHRERGDENAYVEVGCC